MPVEATPAKPHCGIVMPISAIDDCDARHWIDVKAILFEAIETAGFEAGLVSDADDVGVIHKRIVQALYSDPIVVVDVSCRNPNVMTELGLRLAFDKPTIVVKDDKTPFSFDTGVIEHIPYPRSLRHPEVVAFKKVLADKVNATHAAAAADPNFSTFLKHFGPLQVAKIETREVSREQFEFGQLRDELRAALTEIRNEVLPRRRTNSTPSLPWIRLGESMGPGLTATPEAVLRMYERWAEDPAVLSDIELRASESDMLEALRVADTMVLSEMATEEYKRRVVSALRSVQKDAKRRSRESDAVRRDVSK